MAKIKDLIGQKFGRLTVLENCGNKKYCKCDCGNYTHVLTNHLLRWLPEPLTVFYLKRFR